MEKMDSKWTKKDTASVFMLIVYIILLLGMNWQYQQWRMEHSETSAKIVTDTIKYYTEIQLENVQQLDWLEARLLAEEQTTVNMEGWQRALGYVTAYSPYDNVSGIEADANPSITSIGLKPDKGTIAVDPARIPYGSQVMIIYSTGTVEFGIAEDTGGTMRNSTDVWIDVYRDTYKETVMHGKQKAQIYWK